MRYFVRMDISTFLPADSILADDFTLSEGSTDWNSAHAGIKNAGKFRSSVSTCKCLTKFFFVLENSIFLVLASSAMADYQTRT